MMYLLLLISLATAQGCPCSFNSDNGELSCDPGTQSLMPWKLPDCLPDDIYDKVCKLYLLYRFPIAHLLFSSL